MRTLCPSFDPPKRWKKEELSRFQYLQMLSSLTSQPPIRNSSATLSCYRQQKASTVGSEISRIGTSHETTEEYFQENGDEKGEVDPSNSSRKRQRVDVEMIALRDNSPPTQTKLGLFDGAIEIDFSSKSGDTRCNLMSTSIATTAAAVGPTLTATKPLLKTKAKSLFSKLLNSAEAIHLLSDENHDVVEEIDKVNASDGSLRLPSDKSGPVSAKKATASIGKLLTAANSNVRPPSGRSKQTNSSTTQSRTTIGPTSTTTNLARDDLSNYTKDTHQMAVEYSSKENRSGKSKSGFMQPHDYLNLSLSDFDGIQSACRNAGATQKGLEALVQRVLMPLDPHCPEIQSQPNKQIMSLTFIYKDMTSNHATSSVKYCTPSTNLSCHTWYCTCDRNPRSRALSNSLIGAIFSIISPEVGSEPASSRTSTNLPFFLPLSMCVEPDSKESWRLDCGIQLPIQCETTLADRWKAFYDILGSPHVIKIIYNMQVSLLPIVVAVDHWNFTSENWNSTTSQGYELTPMFPNIFDPKIAEYLLHSDSSEDSLELLELQLKYQIECNAYENPHIQSMGTVAKTIAQLSNDLQVLSGLYSQQTSRMSKQRLLPLYWEVESPIACLLASMEFHGVCVNQDRLKNVKAQLEEVIGQLTNQIYECSGLKFNISSPEQVSHVLFEKLQLHGSSATGSLAASAKKFPSTSEEELQKIVTAHPIVPLILDFRSLTKLLFTYIEGLIPFIMENAPLGDTDKLLSVTACPTIDNHRYSVHAYWNQTAVRTGRLSCCKPNLQNIPGDQFVQNQAFNIRSFFQPRSNFILVAADYSQIEMRILAHVSGDSAMCELFRSEGDIYRLLAAKILKKNPQQIADDERTRAKVICLGVLYGMGPQSAATKLGIDIVTASKITNSFFNSFPQVKMWIQRIKSLAKDVGQVRTILGRVRELVDINNSTDSSKRSAAERQAVNSIIQGSASDLIKYAMILSTKKLSTLVPNINGEDCNLGPPRLVMQIHDELIFEVASSCLNYVHTVISTLSHIMEKDVGESLRLKIPLVVNISVGRNWGEMESWSDGNSHEILAKLCSSTSK